MKNATPSLFARIRQWMFEASLNWEIFHGIFSHVCGEKNCGYAFGTDEEMDAATARLNAQALLTTIEQHASNMPESYGKAFRHILHRDLNRRLKMYEKATRCRVNRPVNPRFVAEHA
jgi:hypothetical protein